MRTTRVFVLRLLTDAQEPMLMRGSLRSIADDAEYPFADAQALLTLLADFSAAADPRSEQAPAAPATDASLPPGIAKNEGGEVV